MPRLFLLDAMALAYRAYHAFQHKPLTDSKGQNVGAIFGFVSTLLSLLEKERPDRLIVVFDSFDLNWRYDLFPSYKSKRALMPSDLLSQITPLIEIAEAMGLPVLQPPKTEADDLLATLAVTGKDAGFEVYLVTLDKDLAQVVSDKIFLYDPGKGGKGPTLHDPASVLEKYGVAPSQMADYLALKGDESDDIPGVTGIGDKTAKTLLSTFGSLDELYKRLEEVAPPRIRENLRQEEDKARLFQTLTRLKTDLPLPSAFEELTPKAPDKPRLKALFEEHGFLRFSRQLASWPDLTQSGHDAQEATTLLQPPPTPKAIPLTSKDAIDGFLAAAKGAAALYLHPLFDQDERPRTLLALALAVSDQEAYVLPFLRSQGDALPLFAEAEAHASPAFISPSDALLLLKPLLQDPTLSKVGLDLKESLLALGPRGIGLSGLHADLMLAAHLLEAEVPCETLGDLAPRYLKMAPPSAESIRGAGRKNLPWHRVPPEAMQGFLAQEVALVALLAKVILPKLEGTAFSKLLHEIEMPLIAVLASMEASGIAIETDRLEMLRDDLASRLETIQAQIAQVAQTPDFNPASSQQVAELLFEKLELQKIAGIHLKKTKKKTAYTTDSETLELLLDSHPLPAMILEYRELQKLQSTYIEALPKIAIPPSDPANFGEWPRVHTCFRQAGTATGRLSSVAPNLQNIPIRTAQGREIRKAFIPGQKKDWLLLSADYSQIELRILAHVSQDPRLIEAFEQGLDIHTKTASLIFDVPLASVSSTQRSSAKAINFGILYGMGPPRLAKELQVSQDDAAFFIKSWYGSYPKIKEWIDETIEAAQTLGYVETLFGRRRTIKEIHSPEPARRAAARSMAVNTPIQGASADLIKIAMIQIHQKIQDGGSQARMLLQVHDELLFEVPRSEESALKALVLEEMPRAYPLRVPLLVTVGTGQTWAEAH